MIENQATEKEEWNYSHLLSAEIKSILEGGNLYKDKRDKVFEAILNQKRHHTLCLAVRDLVLESFAKADIDERENVDPFYKITFFVTIDKDKFVDASYDMRKDIYQQIHLLDFPTRRKLINCVLQAKSVNEESIQVKSVLIFSHLIRNRI